MFDKWRVHELNRPPKITVIKKKKKEKKKTIFKKSVI